MKTKPLSKVIKTEKVDVDDDFTMEFEEPKCAIKEEPLEYSELKGEICNLRASLIAANGKIKKINGKSEKLQHHMSLPLKKEIKSGFPH